MHAMMQQIIQTVTNLGQRVDAGASSTNDVSITLHDLELKISEFAANKPQGIGGMTLVNPKELKVREFDGEADKFRDFLEDPKSYFEIIQPDLSELVEWVEYQPAHLPMDEVRARYPSSDAQGRQLHGWLRHKMRGLARQWVKGKDPAQGVQTWRSMLEKCDPTTGASLLDFQQKICEVKRVKNLQDLPNAIDTFEGEYRVYKAKVGKELDDLTRQNMLLRMLPMKWERQMRFTMHTRGRDMVYNTLKHELLDLAVNVSGPMPTGMDLDRFESPGGQDTLGSQA